MAQQLFQLTNTIALLAWIPLILFPRQTFCPGYVVQAAHSSSISCYLPRHYFVEIRHNWPTTGRCDDTFRTPHYFRRRLCIRGGLDSLSRLRHGGRNRGCPRGSRVRHPLAAPQPLFDAYISVRPDWLSDPSRLQASLAART